MSKKVFYEACVEVCDEYSKGGYDVIDLWFEDYKDAHLLIGSADYLPDEPFYFCIKRWEFTEFSEGWDYHYLGKDGTFTPALPKYVMKKLEPHIDTVINHKHFIAE
jgi:hypothetical protein